MERPQGAVAFKPAPNPALNKPLEGGSNQKGLLKCLREPAHTQRQPRRGRHAAAFRVSPA